MGGLVFVLTACLLVVGTDYANGRERNLDRRHVWIPRGSSALQPPIFLFANRFESGLGMRRYVLLCGAARSEDHQPYISSRSVG
ncbi:hypothetical protein BDW42DRAFT_99655 [Aspergillus taichungensis]|uniref:Secreted protein n=1 Tax=Aspergillus taichungensis TaxID=482145 RepID=A0A2J5HVK0_9EURO|nr:hypothetical protein BDW42DRAFT_99655 [Aspergillus taichungensis]